MGKVIFSRQIVYQLKNSPYQKPASLPVRKSPIHLPVRESFNRPVIIYLTACTRMRMPVLCVPDAYESMLNAWRRANTWLVGRYQVMPDHIHLFCAPGIAEYPELRRWVQYWKALASFSWPREYEKPVWHRSFWDIQLRSSESYEQKLEYVRQNPVRKGLVKFAEEWPYQGEMNKLEWFG